MHAMFVAHGPFSGAVKDIHRSRRSVFARGTPPGFHSIEDDAYVLEGFQNVEVYGLVMDLLGVDKATRAPTNGTDGFWEKYL